MIKALLGGLFNHLIRTIRQIDRDLKYGMAIVDAELHEMVGELVARFKSHTVWSLWRDGVKIRQLVLWASGARRMMKGSDLVL
jgi:hypothetical protein